MGYSVIPVIASIVLVLHHVVITDASRWSKLFVATVVAASLAIWRYYPQWLIFATLMQVGASIYMLGYLRVREHVGH